MYHLYILHSPQADRYHIDLATDVEAEIIRYNEADPSEEIPEKVRNHRPWELKASFEVGADSRIAKKILRYARRQKSRLFIEGLIAVKDDPMKVAEMISVPTRREP